MKRLNMLLVMVIIVAISEWWIRIALRLNGDAGDDAFFIDFVAFWAAAKLFLNGEPMLVWDTAAFQIAQAAPRGEGLTMPWFYPPTWNLALIPLGLLPFSVAYLVMIVVSLAAYLSAMMTLGNRTWALFVACPSILLTLMLGNNSVLFAGCLAWALLSLGQPMRAGGLIAVLSMKPGLGLLIPLALGAGRRWAVFAWASGLVIALATVATLVFGIGYWQAFLDGLDIAMTRMAAERQETERMISWFAFARLAGATPEMSLTLHLAAFGALAGLLTLLWWRRGPTDWAMAALMIGVSLTSPHAFHYEQVYAIAGMAFAARAGFDWLGWVLFGLIWATPAQFLMQTSLVPYVLMAAPVITAAFLYCIWRGLRASDAG